MLEVRMLTLREFLSSCKRLIKQIDNPEPDEMWRSVKITLLGIGVIGVIGFVIKFIATMLQSTSIGGT